MLNKSPKDGLFYWSGGFLTNFCLIPLFNIPIRSSRDRFDKNFNILELILTKLAVGEC